MTDEYSQEQQAASKGNHRSTRTLLAKSHWLGEMILASALLLFAALTSGAAYLNIRSKGLGADAAAWVQSAGTVIALGGAIWLARGEARQARRWRRQQGEEAAWAVRFVIMQAQFDSEIIASELSKCSDEIPPIQIRSWRQRAANASLALQTMLTRADHIHPAVVVTACNAKVLVDFLSDNLARLDVATERRENPGESLLDCIAGAYADLAMLLEQYDSRILGLLQILDTSDDMLPLNDWRAR